jgi:hypothetical protein
MAMEWLLGVITVGGMLVLRLAVPVAITVTLAYFVRRLDAKWHVPVEA